MEVSEYNYIATWVMVFGVLGLAGLVLALWIIVGRSKESRRTEREWAALNKALDYSEEAREGRKAGFPSPQDYGTCANCGGHVLAGEQVCRICGQERQAPRQEARYAVVRQDIRIGEQIAFNERELVTIEGLSPDPAMPEYRFIVHSRSLRKRYRLREEDLIF